jgi:hypothetical protein
MRAIGARIRRSSALVFARRVAILRAVDTHYRSVSALFDKKRAEIFQAADITDEKQNGPCLGAVA